MNWFWFKKCSAGDDILSKYHPQLYIGAHSLSRLNAHLALKRRNNPRPVICIAIPKLKLGAATFIWRLVRDAHHVEAGTLQLVTDCPRQSGHRVSV